MPFKFLLSKIGHSWDEIYSEAKSRLDQTEPIFWLVAKADEDQKAIVRIGESTYFSGLYVSEDGLLQKVNPHISEEDLMPYSSMDTYTFNGKPFTKKFEELPGGLTPYEYNERLASKTS